MSKHLAKSIKAPPHRRKYDQGNIKALVDYCCRPEVHSALQAVYERKVGQRFWDEKTGQLLDRPGLERPWVPTLDDAVALVEKHYGRGWQQLLTLFSTWVIQNDNPASQLGGSFAEAWLRLWMDAKNGWVPRKYPSQLLLAEKLAKHQLKQEKRQCHLNNS